MVENRSQLDPGMAVSEGWALCAVDRVGTSKTIENAMVSGALGLQVDPGMAVLGAFGRQVGCGTAVLGALERQVDPGWVRGQVRSGFWGRF